MAGIHTVFDAILDNGITGKKVLIPFSNRKEYETARTRLVALWTEHKGNLIAIAGEDCDPLLPYSLCADYRVEDVSGAPDVATGTFYLGKARRRVAKSYLFTIVSSESTEDGTIESTINGQLPKAVNDGNS